MLETLFLKNGGPISESKNMTRPITSAFSMDNLLNSNLVGKLSGQKNIMLAIKKETQECPEEDNLEERDLDDEEGDEDGKWRCSGYSEGEEIDGDVTQNNPQLDQPPENYRGPQQLQRMDLFNHMLLNSMHRNSIYSGHHNPNLCSLECCRSLKAPSPYGTYYTGQDVAVDLKTSPQTSGGESPHLAKPLLKFSVSAILGTDQRSSRHKPGENSVFF